MIMMTEKDYQVLEAKIKEPNKNFGCPRCGNEIIYQKVGNSVSAKCKTEGCIHYAIRGI